MEFLCGLDVGMDQTAICVVDDTFASWPSVSRSPTPRSAL